MNLVEEYIAKFNENAKQRMELLRNTIHTIVPSAEEGFNYAMPSYKYKGKPLIYFAAYKNHIGVYATPSSHSNFSNELAQYKQGKCSVQFRHLEPFPISLIQKMIVFKQKEIDQKLLAKSKK